MKQTLAFSIVLMLASAAQATTTIDYDWEDGGTVLNVYPDPDLPSLIATNVTADGGNQVYAGAHSLRLEHNDPGETAVAYLAYLWNLQGGDEIAAGFYRYDDTPGALPLVRIAAHWNDELPGNPDGYDGVAGGNEDYGPGQGWDSTSWSWTVSDGHSGLVIEARVNGDVGDVVWLDQLYITVPAEVTLPNDDNTTSEVPTILPEVNSKVPEPNASGK